MSVEEGVWIISFGKHLDHISHLVIERKIFIARASLDWYLLWRMNASESRLKLNLWIVPVRIHAHAQQPLFQLTYHSMSLPQRNERSSRKRNKSAGRIHQLTHLGIIRETDFPTWTICMCLSNIKWNGNILQKVAVDIRLSVWRVSVLWHPRDETGNGSKEQKEKDKYNARTSPANTHLYTLFRCRDMQMSLY